MLRCLKSGQKKEETSSPFLDNGSALLEELITTFNGLQGIPIRSYTAQEIITATNNFADKVDLTDFKYIYRGFMNERHVLVKKFKIGTYMPSNETIRDIAITSQMSHLKNVLKLSGCCLEFKPPVLVYEYVEFKRRDDQLYHTDNLLAWRNRIKIAIGIANVILYLHTAFQTPIIYRDLNPYNVIIDQLGVVKLIDFSLSISLPYGESQVEDEIKGTYGFADPEYLSTGFLTQKSDVYSFGVMFLLLVTREDFRFITNLDGEIKNIIENVKDHFMKDQMSQIIDPAILDQGFDQQLLRTIVDLGMRCTRKRGEDRPEMIDVARELRQIEKSIN